MLVYGLSASSERASHYGNLGDTNCCSRFFKSKFHCFDALIIIAGFIIDVCLKGVLEEAGSIVVILRLWRVFKIVEEFSAGASEQMDVIQELNEKLEKENSDLKAELRSLKADQD